MKSKKSKSRPRQALPSLEESVLRVRRVLQHEREEALEHERAELEDALVAVVGEIQRDKLRCIIAEQMPLGSQPNTTAERKEMLHRVLAAFDRSLIQ